MSADRVAYFVFGARFFQDGENVMFEFAIDHGNKIGPRPATDTDKVKHPAAWAAYEAGIAAQASPAESPPPSEPVESQEFAELRVQKRRGRPPKVAE
jgi:hypothetical protein